MQVSLDCTITAVRKDRPNTGIIRKDDVSFMQSELHRFTDTHPLKRNQDLQSPYEGSSHTCLMYDAISKIENQRYTLVNTHFSRL